MEKIPRVYPRGNPTPPKNYPTHIHPLGSRVPTSGPWSPGPSMTHPWSRQAPLGPKVASWGMGPGLKDLASHGGCRGTVIFYPHNIHLRNMGYIFIGSQMS